MRCGSVAVQEMSLCKRPGSLFEQIGSRTSWTSYRSGRARFDNNAGAKMAAKRRCVRPVGCRCEDPKSLSRCAAARQGSPIEGLLAGAIQALEGGWFRSSVHLRAHGRQLTQESDVRI